MPASCKIAKTILKKSPATNPIKSSLQIANAKNVRVGFTCKGGNKGNKKITIKRVMAVLREMGILPCEKKGKKAKRPLSLANKRKKRITWFSPINAMSDSILSLLF